MAWAIVFVAKVGTVDIAIANGYRRHTLACRRTVKLLRCQLHALIDGARVTIRLVATVETVRYAVAAANEHLTFYPKERTKQMHRYFVGMQRSFELITVEPSAASVIVITFASQRNESIVDDAVGKHEREQITHLRHRRTTFSPHRFHQCNQTRHHRLLIAVRSGADRSRM